MVYVYCVISGSGSIASYTQKKTHAELSLDRLKCSGHSFEHTSGTRVKYRDASTQTDKYVEIRVSIFGEEKFSLHATPGK